MGEGGRGREGGRADTYHQEKTCILDDLGDHADQRSRLGKAAQIDNQLGPQEPGSEGWRMGGEEGGRSKKRRGGASIWVRGKDTRIKVCDA